jgi:carboxymethylenebutenolidase
MSRRDVVIPTPDGDARAYAFTPDDGKGPWPAAIFYMDGMGIRPTLFEMAQFLASKGYFVLMPDMYWRLEPYDPLPAKMLDPEGRRDFFERVFKSTNSKLAMRDTRAFLDWLDKQPEARADKVCITGYCMGGAMTVQAAGTFPDRVVAAAAFHPGYMVTEEPESPHRQVGRIKAKVLVAGALEDPYFTEEEFATVKQAMEDAGVDARVVLYPAHHPFAMPDMPSFDAEVAERHWREMLALFDAALKEPATA